ncbi:Tubby- protein 1 [Conglomerata obtusa]
MSGSQDDNLPEPLFQTYEFDPEICIEFNDAILGSKKGDEIDSDPTKKQLKKIAELIKLVPKYGTTFNGKVHREKKLWFYDFFYEHNEPLLEPKIILKASRTLHGYDIFDISTGKENLISTIRNNFLGSEYTMLYGDLEKWFIKYETNFFGKRGPRKLTAFCKGHSDTGTENITDYIKKEMWGHLVILINKPPYFNQDLGTYMLNFQGRVSEPSVKNFQIIHHIDIREVLLTFGKISKNSFILDYTFPFNAVEAFFFAICAMDSKIGCE